MKYEIYKRKNLILPAGFLSGFLLGYYVAVYQFSLFQIASEYGFDRTQIGILVGLNYGAGLFLPVIFGFIGDRFGKKPFLLFGMMMFFLGQVLLLEGHQTYYSMLYLTFLVGSGLGTVQSMYLSIIADAYPDKVNKYNSFAQAITGLGAFFSPIIAAALIGYDLKWQFALIPSLLGIFIAFLMFFFSEIKNLQPSKNKNGCSALEHNTTSTLLRSPLLYIGLIWMLFYMGLETPTSSFASSFVAIELNTPVYSAFALSAFWIMMAFSRFIWGFVKESHEKIAIVLCTLLFINAMAIYNASNPKLAVCLFALAGFLSGPIWPTIFAALLRAFPHSTGATGALCNAFNGVGGFVWPALFGFLCEGKTLNDIYLLTSIMALISLVCAGLFIIMSKRNLSAHELRVI